jgi:hypothetical protein
MYKSQDEIHEFKITVQTSKSQASTRGTLFVKSLCIDSKKKMLKRTHDPPSSHGPVFCIIKQGELCQEGSVKTEKEKKNSR